MTSPNHRSKPNTSFLSFPGAGGIFRLILLAVPALASAENWPQWRGPRGDGTCLETRVPMEWNVQSNCVWKTELPGTGHSSPIVWGDRLFTATALREKERRILLSLDRRTGEILWQQVVLEAPLEKRNRENSYASGTPTSDGEKVYVAFLAVCRT